MSYTHGNHNMLQGPGQGDGLLVFSLYYDLCKENLDEFRTPMQCSHLTKPEFSSSHRCVAGLDTYILGC